MANEIPELLLLDACRNYRMRFESRFAQFGFTEKLETANALIDCANGLGKYLGRMPDNIVFGRDVFTREQADLLIRALRELQAQAESRAFQPGLAALLALQSMASLILLRHVATFDSTRDRREREIVRIGQHMEKLLAIHRANLEG
jgi:hypothetical protein